MKSVLKGTHFPSVDEVKTKTAQLLNGLGVDELSTALNNGMQRCVDKEEEYIEEDKS